MKLALVLALLLCPTICTGQVFEVSAGSSTLDGVSGASVTTYFANSTLVTSAGLLSDGHVRYSLAYLFRFHGFDVTAGDSQFSFTAGLSGIGIAERGVSFGRNTEKQKLEFFIGETGSLYQAQFATTFGGTSPGAGIFYERRFSHVKVSSLGVVQGAKYTALGAAQFDWRALRATATAGVLQNAREWQAQATWRPRERVSFLASHSDYVDGPLHSIIDEIGASAGVGRLDGNATAFHSVHGWGESAGAGIRISDFATVRESWAVGPNQSPIYLTTGTETFRHWSASQTYTRDGHGSFSFGGAYHSNRFTASIGQQLLYNVTSSKFESATVAALTVHVQNASVNLATSVNRAEHLFLYTASGNDFLGEPINARGHSAEWMEKAKYEISGQVLDLHGNPVSGAALQVGGVVAYTDSAGNFSVRFKKGDAQPFAVLLEQFAAPGRWHVVEAPARVGPGAAVAVVVAR